MNDKDQENGALRGPLIFTVPACGFVMALYLDWLGRSNRRAFFAKTFAQEVEPVEPAIQDAGAPAGKASFGELFRIFRDDYPLCSQQRTRVSGSRE
jgi:hypothetical protein